MRQSRHPRKPPMNKRPSSAESPRVAAKKKAYVLAPSFTIANYQPADQSFLTKIRKTQALTVYEDDIQNYVSLAELRGYERADLFAVAEVGYHYLFNGNPEVALTLFEGLHAVLPSEPYFAMALGLTHDHLKHPKDAIQWYRKASSLAPSDGRPDINCAEIYLELGEFRGAQQYLAVGHRKAQQAQDEELATKAAALSEQLAKLARRAR